MAVAALLRCPASPPPRGEYPQGTREWLVLRTLQSLYGQTDTEEVPIALLKQQLQSASPRFADSELDAVLEQLEDDNHIMFRDWVIHRI